MVYGEPIHKMSALAAPVGGMALEDFNVQGVATSWALGVASVAHAIPATASRRRHPLELPRGMQRPSDSAPRRPFTNHFSRVLTRIGSYTI
jgi:hypothetical protein